MLQARSRARRQQVPTAPMEAAATGGVITSMMKSSSNLSGGDSSSREGNRKDSIDESSIDEGSR